MTTGGLLSLLQFGNRWGLRTLPPADGSLVSADLRHLLGLYAFEGDTPRPDPIFLQLTAYAEAASSITAALSRENRITTYLAVSANG